MKYVLILLLAAGCATAKMSSEGDVKVTARGKAESREVWTTESDTKDTTCIIEAEGHGLTENAINQIWQRERDMMAYAFTAGESLSERNLKLVVADKEMQKLRTQIDRQEDIAESEFLYRFLFG